MTRNKRVVFIGIVFALIAAVLLGTWFANDGSQPESGVGVTESNHGPVLGKVSADCVETYNLVTLKQRAFAFDGTVSQTAVMQPPTDGSAGLDGYLTVTFAVNHWFRGGDKETVTLDMMAPTVNSAQNLSYGIGSRLLVAGEPRFGGSPLKAALAWACGFTRYYDESTAASWRQVFGSK